jgi:hypothetical protein
MTSNTDSDADLYTLLAAALAQAAPDLVKNNPGTTFYGIAIAMAAAIRSRPYLKRSILLDLVRVRPTPESPGRSAPSLSHNAPGTERPTARGI